MKIRFNGFEEGYLLRSKDKGEDNLGPQISRQLETAEAVAEET